MPSIGVLFSRLRIEEKLIFAELSQRGIQFARIKDGDLAFDLPSGQLPERYSLVWSRSLSQSRAFYALQVLSSWGVKTVNSPETMNVCGDKILTTAALEAAGIPTPRTIVALSVEAALQSLDEMGYPAVLKPAVGSWGRLLAKVNDRDAAEAILEHKQTLGGYQHSIFYIQEYVDKPERDIRVIVVGDEPICGMYRTSEHWITNTARGGDPVPCPITPTLGELALRAARATGGGILAIDLLEDRDGRLLVGEVNHTPEFHGAMQATDVSIPAKMVDYVLSAASA